LLLDPAENDMSQNDLSEGARQGTAPPRPTFDLALFVFTAAAVALTGGLLAAVISSRGSFLKIFENFGVKLSGFTVLVISPLFVWLLGALFGLTVINALVVKNRTVRAVGNAAAILAAMVLAALYVADTLLALIVEISSVSR
jgi:hypothetical protein